MDGGLEIENALRYAVRTQKDYSNFADTARAVGNDLGISTNERARIFGALAKSIIEWDAYGTIPK